MGMSRTYHVETVPFTSRTHLVIRSPQDVRAASEFYFARFKNEHAAIILPVDDEKSVRVNRILSKIVGAIQPSLASRSHGPLDWAVGLDWEAVVLRRNSIRAMCLVGAGKIVVHTGLLDRFDADEEIAVILAHEVGHVIARHSSEMIGRRELEADYIGMMLLSTCGFDPHVSLRALEKFEKIERKKMIDKILFFLAHSTHPSPKKRSQFLSRPKVMEESMELYTRDYHGLRL